MSTRPIRSQKAPHGNANTKHHEWPLIAPDHPVDRTQLHYVKAGTTNASAFTAIKEALLERWGRERIDKIRGHKKGKSGLTLPLEEPQQVSHWQSDGGTGR